MADVVHHYEDEIELIDILRVLWKWKVLIVAGALLFGGIAFAVTLKIPKIFNVEMIFQAGLLSTGETGQKIYLDPVDSIAGRIRAGIYDDKVMAHVSTLSGKKPQSIGFKVDILTQVDAVHVNYETVDPEIGVEMLTYLFSLLSEEENILYLNIVENYNLQISFKNIEIQNEKAMEESCRMTVKLLDQRIKEIYDDIDAMKKNSVYLNDERKKLLERKIDETGTLSVLLYNTTIQQNIQYISNLRRDLNEHLRSKEPEYSKIIFIKNEQKQLTEEVLIIEKQRDSIRKMKLVKSPIVSNQPAKPNKQLIVLLALMAGLFCMVFLSFFIEYIRNNRVSS